MALYRNSFSCTVPLERDLSCHPQSITQLCRHTVLISCNVTVLSFILVTHCMWRLLAVEFLDIKYKVNIRNERQSTQFYQNVFLKRKKYYIAKVKMKCLLEYSCARSGVKLVQLILFLQSHNVITVKSAAICQWLCYIWTCCLGCCHQLFPCHLVHTCRITTLLLQVTVKRK